jgi:pimeloyl-ACP methyl ester carboxylesterase
MEVRSGSATSGDLKLYYEDMGDIDDPPVLLIMGLGAQLLLWRTGFCEKLVGQGLRVIRYDNRDVGLSSKTEHRSWWRGWPGPGSACAATRDTRWRTWPTTPRPCWITSTSSTPTSWGRRWAA